MDEIHPEIAVVEIDCVREIRSDEQELLGETNGAIQRHTQCSPTAHMQKGR